MTEADWEQSAVCCPLDAAVSADSVVSVSSPSLLIKGKG